MNLNNNIINMFKKREKKETLKRPHEDDSEGESNESNQ